MRESVVRIIALVSLAACTLSSVTGCKKKSAFPEKDSFTTYTIPVEERKAKATESAPFLVDEAAYKANLHPVPDYFTFLPADDEKLIDHYSCSPNNMFGLKEIYVYENTVLMVFDQETFDSIDTLYNFDRNPEWATSWEEDYYKEAVVRQFEYSHSDGWATTGSGKDRICIVKTFYSEEKKNRRFISEEASSPFWEGILTSMMEISACTMRKNSTPILPDSIGRPMIRKPENGAKMTQLSTTGIKSPRAGSLPMSLNP